MKKIAVIGGTGLDQLKGLSYLQECSLDTPYGVPSRPIQTGVLAGHTLFFLQRHGAPLAIPPHRINYRANMWALHSLGVTDVIAVNAVGGITPRMHAGALVIPDQIIDYTWGREHSIDDGSTGSLLHVDFTEPYDAILRTALAVAAAAEGIDHRREATHGVTQGPRLESAAEIRRMEQDGCHIVGMTGMPEAALARELGMKYAAVCMVVNAAAGKGDGPITMDTIRETLEREAALVARLLSRVFQTGLC